MSRGLDLSSGSPLHFYAGYGRRHFGLLHVQHRNYVGCQRMDGELCPSNSSLHHHINMQEMRFLPMCTDTKHAGARGKEHSFPLLPPLLVGKHHAYLAQKCIRLVVNEQRDQFLHCQVEKLDVEKAAASSMHPSQKWSGSWLGFYTW